LRAPGRWEPDRLPSRRSRGGRHRRSRGRLSPRGAVRSQRVRLAVGYVTTARHDLTSVDHTVAYLIATFTAPVYLGSIHVSTHVARTLITARIAFTDQTDADIVVTSR
jgi:hypothetical protein